MSGQAPVTSGDTAGTSGEWAGTSGDRFPWPAWFLLALLVCVNAVVNATSILIEVPEGRRSFGAWEPVLWEASSVPVILALAPLVWKALQRWPLRPPWWRTALVHLALTIPFSIAHVLLMLAIRLLVYSLAGEGYDYFRRGVGTQFFYEWRKDALGYALMLAIFWTFARVRQLRAAPPPSSEPLIGFKASGGTVHLRPSSIRLVVAAGNYVEIEADGQRHLVRMTLAAIADMLGPDFIRIHRSRLVNRNLIRGERPQPSGDVLLDLTDGTALIASRRYRDRLPSAGLQPVTKLQ